jgi:hypothetical protein
VRSLYGTAVYLTLTASEAGCPSGSGTCSYTPTTALAPNMDWAWFVNATNAYGTSAWSDGKVVRVN